MARSYQRVDPTAAYASSGRGSGLLAGLFNTGPYILALFSFSIAVSALISLIGFDVVAGQVSIQHMSNPTVGWFASLATTGLQMALFGSVMYGIREQWGWGTIVALIGIALIPAGIDIYFDYLAPDVIRFGMFIELSTTLSLPEQFPHLLFRCLSAGISLVGEPLAATSIIIFPVLRELFQGSM